MKNSRFIKRVLAILVVFGLVLSLAACKKKTAEQPQQSSQNKNIEEKITLTFTHMFTNDGSAISDGFYNALNEYKKAHPNVTIKQEALSHDTYETKIKTLAAGGELPDVFVIKGSMVDPFYNNGQIAPLNDALASNREWKNSFVEGACDDFQRGDKILGIPIQVQPTSLIFYNREIFKEAGINEFPKDWNEFKDVVKKLRAKGYIPITAGNKGKWLVESCILSTLGDRFTGTDWFVSIRDRKGAKFTDPEFVNALRAIDELVKMKAFNSDINSLDNNQQRTLYYNKKAAMFFEGGWAISLVTNEAPKDVLDATELAIIPPVPGGKGLPNTVSGGAGWAFQINAKLDGSKKNAALALLKALSSDAYSRPMLEKGGFPATKVKNYDESKLSTLAKKYQQLAKNIKYVPVYDVQLSPGVIEVMNSGLQDMIIGTLTPEKLAQKIQQEYEREASK